MKDFRIQIGVRNNALLEIIEDRGFRMGPSFAKDAGVAYHTLSDFVFMRRSPVVDGRWHPIVIKVADFLRCLPDELFRGCHIEPLAKNKVERKADAQEVFDLLNAPEADDATALLERKELAETVEQTLGTLTERERDVLERHTMGNETLRSIATSYGVTSNRIMQIEHKALRKLRNPTRLDPLRLAARGQTWEQECIEAELVVKPARATE